MASPRKTSPLAGSRLASGSYDLILAVTGPEPIVVYLQKQLASLMLEVVRLDVSEEVQHQKAFLCVTAMSTVLEPLAEQYQLEKPLKPDAERLWSETGHPQRVFTCADRTSFVNSGVVEFTPSERSGLVQSLLETQLVADGAWPAALAAAGRADAASEPKGAWLVGPNESWINQPLVSALTQLGYLEAIWAPHTSGRWGSLGVPLRSFPSRHSAIDWKAYLLGLLTLRGELLSVDTIQGYWGDKVCAPRATTDHDGRARQVPLTTMHASAERPPCAGCLLLRMAALLH